MLKQSADYSSSFYQQYLPGSRRSATEIVPLVTEMLKPRSVVDVGCGTGAWLSVFKTHGVNRVLGLDGTLDADLLQISPTEFKAVDLTGDWAVTDSFDLAVCLEVAEHLPRRNARDLVRALTTLGPAVLFSAAIPGQGGVHHVNEQWPDYWAELFSAESFSVVDALRLRLWNNENIEPWYAQNLLLFMRTSALCEFPELAPYANQPLLRLVHPRMFQAATDLSQVPLRRLLSLLPAAVMRAARRRAYRLPYLQAIK